MVEKESPPAMINKKTMRLARIGGGGRTLRYISFSHIISLFFEFYKHMDNNKTSQD
jgi:hypothetical protein